jgi:hypothetical protein
VPDDAARLRVTNARLRQVVEARDTEIAVLRASHQAQLDALRAQVAALAGEVAELRARLGQNPRNSSNPPPSEGLGIDGTLDHADNDLPKRGTVTTAQP